MPRRRKVKVSSVLQMMPHLFKLTRAKSRRQREELLKNFDTPQKDVLTRLLEVALDNIPQESLTPAQLKAINSSGEQLRFLKFYSKCKKKITNYPIITKIYQISKKKNKKKLKF